MAASGAPLVSARRKIVLGTLSAMLVGLAGLMVLRSRVAHDPPAAAASSSAPIAASSGPIVEPSASVSPAASGSATPPRPVFQLGRPLRVAALGWDIAAPVVVANDGLEPGKASLFNEAGIAVRVSVPADASAVESALARGGDDREGADVALMPLPDLVAGWERLRALSPRIFLVVGWSRGREALYTTRDSLVGSKKDAVLAAPSHDASAFLGLFVLGKAGLSPRLTASLDGKAEFTASDRTSDPANASRGRLLLTTADAPRLVPIVAVAPSGLFEKHTPLLIEWSRQWMEGQSRVQQDAAAAARKVAALPGAPEPLILVRRLGEVAPASLWDNARAAGLAGRSAVPLDRLFQESWQTWRAAGVLTTPLPEPSAVQPQIIASLVRSAPSLTPPGTPAQELKGRADEVAPLLVARVGKGKLDDSALESEIGFIAGVFERSVVRVAIAGRGGIDEARTRKLIQSVAERFEFPASRIVPSRATPVGKEAAVVEVLPVL